MRGMTGDNGERNTTAVKYSVNVYDVAHVHILSILSSY